MRKNLKEFDPAIKAVLDKNMELGPALKTIVEIEGKEVLNDIRLVNMLDDYKAFENIPASKNILKMLISDGYVNQFLSVCESGDNIESFCHYIASTSGFQIERIEYVIQSISFALGLKDGNTTNPKAEPVSKKRTLFDILEVDNSSMIDMDTNVENVFIEYSGKKTIHVTCEAYKDSDNSVTLYFVIFDKMGRVRKKEVMGYVFSAETHKFIDAYCDLPVPRTNLSKILITAY